MKMFFVSIVMVCFAHIVRIYRWSLFVRTYEKPPVKIMMDALAMGYLLNYFLPLKLGDVVRAFIAGRKMKNGRGFSLATVIIERCLDVFAVGIIFALFYRFGFVERKNFIGYSVLAFLILIIVVICIAYKRQIKYIINFIARIFNVHLEEKLLRFAWALIWGFKDIGKKISIAKLIFSTLLMWGLYFSSYWYLAIFLDDSDWKNVFFYLFDLNVLFAKQSVIVTKAAWYGVYFLLPAGILLLLSFMIKDSDNGQQEDYLNLIPHVNETDRRSFLEQYFSSENTNFVNNYLSINRKIYILRDCSAGSNATTILCNAGGNNFYRKYAFGNEGEKLLGQVEWIQKHNRQIPLPEIIQVEHKDDYCYYDMPFNINAVSLFEYAHSAEKEKAWEIIKNTLNCLKTKLYGGNREKANDDKVKKYVFEKVTVNLRRIYESEQVRRLLKFDFLVINGRQYRNLPYYEKYLNEDFLYDIFIDDFYTDIHGDLTIENIICLKDFSGRDGFYLIDPNMGNVHDSPNLDYAKLLQSLHGNYEFLMATEQIMVKGNRIEFKFIKSDSYKFLLEKMDDYMAMAFSYEQVRSIYFHEVIHWIRLLPYKIKKDGKRALLFYAGLLIVLDDVVERYVE